MTALETLKELDINNASLSLWIFKKSSSANKAPVFTGRWVDITDDLENALKAAVLSERDRIEEVIELTLLAQNHETSVLSVGKDETHAALVTEQASAETAQKKVRKVKDIQNASFYAIKIVSGDDVVFAVRKADPSWRAKKKTTMISVMFTDNHLGLDNDPGFNISKYIDFFIVDEAVLVSDKRNFESVLSYKEAHKGDFSALQQEPEFTAIFSSLEVLISHVGENKIQLRRTSAIRQKGHYKNENFMRNLRERGAEFGLNLQFDEHGRIVPSVETCKDILQALLDHRLTSAFSQNIYDVPDAISVRV